MAGKFACPICFETFSNTVQPYMLMSCSHNYCKHCIDNWINSGKNTCPKCRTYINNKTINRGLLQALETSNSSNSSLNPFKNINFNKNKKRTK